MEVQETENVAAFKQRFDNFVHEFTSKSQNHCIVTREKASRILRLLNDDPSVEDIQLKFYVKQKQFQLRDFPQFKLKNVLCVPTSTSRKSPSRANQGMFGKYRRVALKDEFFSIIYEIHTQEGSNKHLAYKSTVQEINRHHAHIPRAAVLNFTKMCPLCSQSLEDLDLLSAGDLSQSSNENNDNRFPGEDSFVDIKPDIHSLAEAVSHSQFANSQSQDVFSFFRSSSGQPHVASLRYSPAPPPSATQWSNSLHRGHVDSPLPEIIEANHFMAVGKVSIIDIQELLSLSTPPKHYTCLVHYVDVWSKYSVLWPLRLKDIDELAFGIAKNVFAYFGSPKQIIYDTDFDEAQQLEESLKKWSKEVQVTVGLQEPLASSGPVHWKIVEKLKELLVESWEVKLSKLQYISNTKLMTTHGHISPYKAVTGSDPLTEAFSELADKYNIHPDCLQPDFLSTEIRNNLQNETILKPPNELAGYSVYSTSPPTRSNVCRINLTDNPVISSPVATSHQMGPTPIACTLNVASNGPTHLSNQLELSGIDQKVSHNTGSVSSSIGHYPSPGSQVTTADVHSQQEMPSNVSNGNSHHNHMIYIDDDDDEDDGGDTDVVEYDAGDLDRKNVLFIEDLSSTMRPSFAEHPSAEHRAENDDTKNAILLPDITPSLPPVTPQVFPTVTEIQDNDTKNILLIEEFDSMKQPSTSQNPEAVETEKSVSVLDNLPRLAQSFSFPSVIDNQEEAGRFSDPTDLETSLATSLADCGLPYFNKSAQHVIDKYRLRAKILNSTQMKATRYGGTEGRLNHAKSKVYPQQQPPPSSAMLSTISKLQPKQRILYGITSANSTRGYQSTTASAHRLKSRTARNSSPDLEDKRKEYWRRMKQRARARLSQEEREIINERRRQKYAERKRFGNESDHNHLVLGDSSFQAPFGRRV